jgi:hypothetical protein
MQGITSELKSQHKALADAVQLGETDKPALVSGARRLMDRISSAGVEVGDPDERALLWSYLRTWASFIYEQSGTYPQVDLPPLPLDELNILIACAGGACEEEIEEVKLATRGMRQRVLWSVRASGPGQTSDALLEQARNCHLFILFVRDDLDEGTRVQTRAALDAARPTLVFAQSGHTSRATAQFLQEHRLPWREYHQPCELRSVLPSAMAGVLAEAGATRRISLSDYTMSFLLTLTQPQPASKIDTVIASLRQDQESDYLVQLRQVCDSFSKAYGLAYEYQDVNCRIHEDGTATINRAAKLIAYSSVDTFFIYIVLPERDERGHFLPAKITSLTRGRKLTVAPPTWVLSRQLSTVKVSPPLQNGHELEFSVVEAIGERVYRTPKNHKRSLTPDDYFCWDINYPTRNLGLNVELPAGMQVESYDASAWYSVGRARTLHLEETERAKQHLAAEHSEAYRVTLSLTYPLLSLSYGIIWYPSSSYSGAPS